MDIVALSHRLHVYVYDFHCDYAWNKEMLMEGMACFKQGCHGDPQNQLNRNDTFNIPLQTTEVSQDNYMYT